MSTGTYLELPPQVLPADEFKELNVMAGQPDYAATAPFRLRAGHDRTGSQTIMVRVPDDQGEDARRRDDWPGLQAVIEFARKLDHKLLLIDDDADGLPNGLRRYEW